MAFIQSEQGVATGSVPPRVEVVRSVARLGEVVDLARLPGGLRRAAGRIVVAAVGPGEAPRRIDGLRACRRARAQLPALEGRLDCGSAHDLILAGAPRPPAAPRARVCARLTRALARDEAPTADDLRPDACRSGAAAFRYDASTGLARARRDLEPGAAVTPPPAAMLAQASAGQTLRLTATVGPVRVERAVEVARPARAGAALVVRGRDGEAFVTPAGSVTP